MFLNVLTTLLILVWSLSSVYAADNTKDADDWQLLIEPYFWVPDVPITAANGESIEITQDQILDNLDGALMLFLGARKDKWSFYLDTVYADLEGDDKGSRQVLGLPGDPTIRTEIDIGVRAWLITATGGYAVIDSGRNRLEVLAGVRYYWERISLGVDVGSERVHVEDEWTNWDGLVGVKGTTNLNDRWYISYLADVGTGDTDLTYQLWGGLNYRLSDFTVVGGYRYFKWEFSDSSKHAGNVAEDQTLKGPFLGLKFVF
jgi:hypothetical protein